MCACVSTEPEADVSYGKLDQCIKRNSLEMWCRLKVFCLDALEKESKSFIYYILLLLLYSDVVVYG